MIKKINIYRRNSTKFLTQKLGQNSYINVETNQIEKVLVIRPNHRLGNILLITPLIEEVIHHFPNAKIDLFVKGKISEIIFEKHSKIDMILALPKNHFKELLAYISIWFKILTKRYDLVINANSISSSGQIAAKLARGKFKFFGEEKENKYEQLIDYFHFAKFGVYNFRAYLSKSWPNLVFDEIPKLHLTLSEQEIEKGQEIINAITKNNKKTIAFFTYATGDKCYSKEFWAEMYSKMQVAFGKDYNLIEILPVENVSQIDFIAPNFYSKDIREIAAVLKNTELFLGADSGMMHLATTNTTTFGLFSKTPTEKYQPFGQFNMGINMNDTSIDNCILLLENYLKQKNN